MDQNLAVAIMFVAILLAITKLIIAVIDYRLKLKVIKSGLLNDSTIKAFNKLATDFSFNTLKWGIILLFGGIGLIILEYIPYSAKSTLPYGIEAILLSLGFITYYLLSRKFASRITDNK